MNVPQRITDYLRERRIRALSREMCEFIRYGMKAEAAELQAAWSAEIRARSPQQIARMEAAQRMRLSPSDRAMFDRYKDGAK